MKQSFMILRRLSTVLIASVFLYGCAVTMMEPAEIKPEVSMEVTFWVDKIGTYDADRGIVPITICGRTEEIQVPRSLKAENLVTVSFASVTIAGRTEKLTVPVPMSLVGSLGAKSIAYADGKWEVGNMVIEDSQTGFRHALTIRERTEEIAVPLSLARSFKENKDKLVVKWERRLTAEGKYTYYNLMIENPLTGNRYPFGPQTEQRLVVPKLTAPPKLATRLHFVEPSGNGYLDAEEEGKVMLTVENKGKGSAYSFIVQLSPQGETPHLSYEQERIIPEIKPGAQAEVAFSLQAGSEVATRQYSFVLTMEEANGFEPASIPFSIQTHRFMPPDLHVVDLGVTDASQNGKIEPGELAEITARVQNRGKGEAKAVKAEVVLGENVFFTEESQRRFDLGNIPPGAYKDVVFTLYTNNRIKDKIPVSLRLTEQRDRFSKREPLALSVNRVQKRPEEIVFTGQAKPEVEIKDVATLSVDIEQDIPKTKAQNPNAVAVVIGNQHYKHIGNVDYANRDATVMQDYLAQAFGYKTGNILRYSDVTKTDFEALFGSHADHKGKLYRKARAGGEVFIYYSGHGHSEGQNKPSYFVPSDAEVSTIGLTGYPLKVFYDNIARLIAEKHPKRVVVVMESCFSGYLAEGVSSTRWVSDNPLLTLKSSGAVVMTAASGSETAKWYKEKQHGLFTYFLLKAFQNSPNEGGKRADANGDGRLTLREIQAFVSDQSYGVPYFAPLYTGDEQTPVIMGDKSTVLLEW